MGIFTFNINCFNTPCLSVFKRDSKSSTVIKSTLLSCSITVSN
jgi:hypothetical protein